MEKECVVVRRRKQRVATESYLNCLKGAVVVVRACFVCIIIVETIGGCVHGER